MSEITRGYELEAAALVMSLHSPGLSERGGTLGSLPSCNVGSYNVNHSYGAFACLNVEQHTPRMGGGELQYVSQTTG